MAYEDGTDVRYDYDGFGRKVRRLETYWQEPGPSENGLEHGKGFTQGQRKGLEKENGNGKDNGKSEKNKLKLREEETTYLYDGLLVFQEFTGEGSPLGEYMRGNDLVASRKTFGFHGRKDESREGNLRTRGGLLYYGYDGLGSVTDLTDRSGDVAMQYRYDAFGGMFTGITSPYNTVGFTDKSYDPKAELVEFYARWYDPSVGRFTTQDSYLGELVAPASQHRYAYVLNNPATHVDRWGYVVEDDPGGGSFDEWYSHSSYRYTTETTTSYETTAVSGNDLVYYEVTTTYTDTWEVTFTYYHNSLGYTYLYDESVPRHVGRSSSSSREEIRRETIDDDTKVPGSGTEPSEPEITEPGSPETSRPPRLTAAERAEMKRNLALQRAAGMLSQDEYEKALKSLDGSANPESQTASQPDLLGDALRYASIGLAVVGTAAALAVIVAPTATIVGGLLLVAGAATYLGLGIDVLRWRRGDISNGEMAASLITTALFMGAGKGAAGLASRAMEAEVGEAAARTLGTRVEGIVTHPSGIVSGLATALDDN